MSHDSRPPYHRRKTNPIPRAELAPIGPAPEVGPEDITRPDLEATERLARSTAEEALTQCRCPLCCGTGMVSPEIAATFEGLCAQAKEQL